MLLTDELEMVGTTDRIPTQTKSTFCFYIHIHSAASSEIRYVTQVLIFELGNSIVKIGRSAETAPEQACVSEPLPVPESAVPSVERRL